MSLLCSDEDRTPQKSSAVTYMLVLFSFWALTRLEFATNARNAGPGCHRVAK